MTSTVTQELPFTIDTTSEDNDALSNDDDVPPLESGESSSEEVLKPSKGKKKEEIPTKGLLRLPDELLVEITKRLPKEGIELLTYSCRRLYPLCQSRMKHLRAESARKFFEVHLYTGLSENTLHREPVAGVLHTLDDRDRVFIQKLCLTQADGYFDPMTGYCGDETTFSSSRGGIRSYRGRLSRSVGRGIDGRGRGGGNFEHGRRIRHSTDRLEDTIRSRLDALRSSFTEQQLLKLDPLLRYEQKGDRAAERAMIRLALAQLCRVRYLEVTTTKRGDEGFLLKVMKQLVNCTINPRHDPIGPLFNFLVTFTLISRSQIEQSRTQPKKKGDYLKSWGIADHVAHQELRLLACLLALPTLRTVRCYGLCQTWAPELSKGITFPQSSSVTTLIFKRCYLWKQQVTAVVAACKSLKVFTLDICKPSRIWRLEYRPSRIPTDYVDESWYSNHALGLLQGTMEKLQENAAETLEMLDLSCEMGGLHDVHSALSCYSDRPLKTFRKLRVLAVNINIWPPQNWDENGVSLESKYRVPRFCDMVHLLPSSIEKVHFTGKLNEKCARQIFKKLLDSPSNPLPALVHISSDMAIPFEVDSQQAKNRVGRMFVEVAQRSLADKLVSPRADAGGFTLVSVDDIWMYPDMKNVGSGSNSKYDDVTESESESESESGSDSESDPDGDDDGA